ncbi:MAG: S1C family serine protease [Planctomyces sp.]
MKPPQFNLNIVIDSTDAFSTKTEHSMIPDLRRRCELAPRFASESARVIQRWLLLPLLCAAAFSPEISMSAAEAVSSPGLPPASIPAEIVRAAVGRIDPYLVRLTPIGVSEQGESSVSSKASTGLIISEKGEILTSTFLMEGQPSAILVETIDGRRASAVIVARDYIRQIALLRSEDLISDPSAWKAPETKPNTDSKVGQWMIAAGRFYAADSSSLSVGILSARDRIHGMALQTDAKISPVNYGGTLIDVTGSIHGLITPMSVQISEGVTGGVEWYDSGVGFAVPIEDAITIADRLRSGKDLKPGLAGFSISGAAPFSEEVRIRQIHPGSPAEKAGLQVADRIMSVNGIAVTRPSVIERELNRSAAGDLLTLVLQRQGQIIEASVALVESLPVLRPGFVGIIPCVPKSVPADPAQEIAEAPCNVMVVNNSSASRVGLSGVIEILAVNDQPMKQLGDLLPMLFLASLNSSVKLTYREIESSTPDIPADTQNTPTDPAKTPNDTPSPEKPAENEKSSEKHVSIPVEAVTEFQSKLDDDDRLDYFRTTVIADKITSDVQRRELPLGDDGKCLLISASDSAGSEPVPSGLILLLTDPSVSEEKMIREWQDVLSSHRLTLLLPVVGAKNQLTDDDLPAIAAALEAAIKDRPIDRGRIVVVADEQSIRLAERVLFAARSPVRGAALLSGVVRTPEGLTAGRFRRSVLLLNQGNSLQFQALISESRRKLQAIGYRVFLPELSTVSSSADSPAEKEASSADAPSPARLIGDFSILLRAL